MALSREREDVSDAPDLPTALLEQLGLRLVPENGSIEVIVIDHIERPSEN
jgi:bla regulator protein BlaR1